MEEVLKQLNELCRDTLVDNLGMVFTAAGEGWLEARMPIDRRTCRPDGALHGGANMALAETVGGALSSMSVPPENRFHVFGIEVNGNHMNRHKEDMSSLRVLLFIRENVPTSFRSKYGTNTEHW